MAGTVGQLGAWIAVLGVVCCSGLSLAAGPGAASQPSTQPDKPTQSWFDLKGFWETRVGLRTQNDPYQGDASIGETRLQLDLKKTWKTLTFRLTTDFVYDAVLDHHRVRLEEGQGLLDLRRANVRFTPQPFVDVTVGRQILTWGTGDLLIINDMFPKDWQAFLIGRALEYLAAPSDSLKVSLSGDLANLDVVFTPRFDADRFPSGQRLSIWNPLLQRRSGRDDIVEVNKPDKWFEDHEWAVRLWKKVGEYELAAYGYWGFWPIPAGIEAAGTRVSFPRLSVYGASLRAPLFKGVFKTEIGYYDSRQDVDGSDPLIRNSELRFLVGYNRALSEWVRDLTVGVQYYTEYVMEHAEYLRTLPAGVPAAEELHQIITFRITKLLMDQNLKLSFFAYYSPSDSDAYLRPKISYRIDDHWVAELGANIFIGKYEHTLFGQFERNTSIYATLRYGF